MDFEKFVQLIGQATGTISSLQCITANLVSFIAAVIFRKHITYLYGTLNGMNNPIINVATWGLLFSVYIMIYKAVSAVFKFVADRKNALKAEQEKIQRLERLKQDIATLSNNEIAIIKFLLNQDQHTAWLPKNLKHVLLLRKKGILYLFCNEEKKISSDSLYYSDFFSRAQMYALTNHAQNIISQLPLEIRKKWRKVKPDNTLKDCQ